MLTQRPGNLGKDSDPPLSLIHGCTDPPLPSSPEPITPSYLCVLCCLTFNSPSSAGLIAAILEPQPPSHSLLTSRCQGNILQSIYLSSSNCSFFVLLLIALTAQRGSTHPSILFLRLPPYNSWVPGLLSHSLTHTYIS